jgi:hypothetical protein
MSAAFFYSSSGFSHWDAREGWVTGLLIQGYNQYRNMVRVLSKPHATEAKQTGPFQLKKNPEERLHE